MTATDTTFCRIVTAVIAMQCVLVGIAALGSPYMTIGERNVFGLKEPPSPEPLVPEKEPDPPANIKVTGITMFRGTPRAILKVQTPAKPPEPAREDSYILVAGGAGKGGIEVLAIDENHGEEEKPMVKVRHAGKDSWLALEKDTVKAAPAAPAGAAPAQVAAVQTAVQKLAAARAAATGGIPNRPVRGGTQGMPGLAQSATQRARVFQARDQIGNLSPEEQVILIEANRLKTLKEQAEGLMPPPPATALTPEELNPTTPTAPEDPLNDLLQEFPQ